MAGIGKREGKQGLCASARIRVRDDVNGSEEAKRGTI